jgi:16S rRNA (adenine1518-N6/adenine1519-N6)-dimethyltransferase
MGRIRPKKNLGQHFLKDRSIAEKIAGSLTGDGFDSVLEIGPGMGILTEFLLKRQFNDLRVIEIDNESVHYLRENFPGLKEIIRGDFLSLDIESCFSGRIAVIGNFPYNISSQILFRVLDHRDQIIEVCGMFQKEVAERICASPGSKTYGILSVLVQAFYSAEYLFTVPEHVFFPQPKVKSGVIRLVRNQIKNLGCNEFLFFKVVKTAFSQRRKTLRNSIKSGFSLRNEENEYFRLRPERLSVDQFVNLTNWIDKNRMLSE